MAAATRARLVPALFLLVAMGVGRDARAQQDPSTQFWGNVIVGHPRTERIKLQLDLEGSSQVGGDEGWRGLKMTPRVEYYPGRWLTVSAEAAIAYTHQLDGLNTFHLTPRIGASFHLFRRVRKRLPRPERLSGTRLDLANLTRLEARNLWYSDHRESRHEWRLLNRTEALLALNRSNLAEEGTLYLMASGEFFVPLGDEIPERFANKFRARLGLGYRIDFGTRLEFLYMRDSTKSTLEEEFTDSANIFDFRLKIFF